MRAASNFALTGPGRSGLGFGLRLLAAYWRTRDSLLSWLMLLTLLGFTLGGVYISVWQNDWQGQFFDALQRKDLAAFQSLVVWYVVVAAVSIGVNAMRTWFNRTVTMRWREWLTRQYLDAWMADRHFHRIEAAGRIDNPDQRLAQDIAEFTSSVVGVSFGLVVAVTSVGSFAAVLWRLGGALDIEFAGQHWQLPGYLVLVAVAYALLGSWLVVKMSGRMVEIVGAEQRLEAGFRFLLIHVRRGAEQIAFFRGERAERQRLAQAFAKVRDNWNQLTLSQVRVVSTQGVYGEVSGLLPLLLAMPRFFAGQVTFGAVMQTRDAFLQLNASLSWFVQSYQAIAHIQAITRRIRGLSAEMVQPAGGGIQRDEATDGAVRITQLQLQQPDGQPLLGIGSLTLPAGQRWLVQGRSGVGKSTLLRALAGLWPHGSGAIALPPAASQMFVSQRPFFPVGTLRDALAFPALADTVSPARCAELLRQCALPQLVARLDDQAEWDRELSPGEQQRVAFCRVLLQRPQLLILDEATSALDPATAQQMYTLVAEALPQATVISVAHGDGLDRFHTHRLRLDRGHPPELTAVA